MYQYPVRLSIILGAITIIITNHYYYCYIRLDTHIYGIYIYGNVAKKEMERETLHLICFRTQVMLVRSSIRRIVNACCTCANA